jgi:hypothetical protein
MGSTDPVVEAARHCIAHVPLGGTPPRIIELEADQPAEMTPATG